MPETSGKQAVYSYNIGSRDVVENKVTINNFPATPHAITSNKMKERVRRKSDKKEVRT